jgi:hypothetical protein
MIARPLRLLGLAACAGLALAACQTLRPRKPAPAVVAPPAAPPPAEKPPPPPPLIRIPLPPPPKSCVPKTLAPPPRYPDSDAALRAAAGAADRYQLMAAGRILRAQRLEDLERIVAGCRAP